MNEILYVKQRKAMLLLLWAFLQAPDAWRRLCVRASGPDTRWLVVDRGVEYRVW